MDGKNSPRGGGCAGLLVIALLAASALVAWRLLGERNPSPIDSGGFDMSAAPQSRTAPAAAGSGPAAAAPRSGLELLKVDEEIRAGAPRSRAGASAPSAASARTLAQSRLEFIALARRNEGVVRRFAERMSAQSPVIRQYGRDWMSHTDLRSLTDNYWRDHDPVAFMEGLARAPSFPLFVKQYAGVPEIRSFVVLGLTKEAPHDLAAAGANLMHDDASLKQTISEVGTALGLPPSLAAKIGAPDAQKPAPPAAQ